MRILCDCDGVVADLIGYVIDCAPAGLGISLKDFHTFERAAWRPTVLEHFVSMLDALTLDEHRAVPAHDDICNALCEAVDGGDVLVFLTAPWSSGHWHRGRLGWISENFRFWAHSTVFASAADKPFMRGDVLIEDRIETLIAWLKLNPKGIGIAVARAWNRQEISTATLSNEWGKRFIVHEDPAEFSETLAAARDRLPITYPFLPVPQGE